MEWLETTEKTVEDAKDFLLDQLGVDEDEAEFEILEEPKAGLFGRQRGVARVRARIAPKTPRPKDERRRRKPKDGAGGSRAADGGNAGSSGSGSGNGAGQEPAARAPKPAAEDRPARQPRQGRDGGQGREGRPPAEPVEPEPFVAPLVGFYEGILTAAGLEGSVSVTITEDQELAAAIDGSRLGALIGPGGGVVDALQELGRTFLQKEAKGGSSPRMKLDVAKYKEHRREQLAAFAVEVATKVRETNTAHAFEVMGSADRKAIHDAVNELDDVTTSSQGEDPDRYVVIAPA